MKEKIKLLAKDFGGNLKDIQVIEVLKISRNTYFKYKRELKEKYILSLQTINKMK